MQGWEEEAECGAILQVMRGLEGFNPGQHHGQIQVSETAQLLGGQWIADGPERSRETHWEAPAKQWGPNERGKWEGYLGQGLKGTG